MLKESKTAAKSSPAKAIAAGVLFAGALGFVGWQVYGMFAGGEATPLEAVQKAEAHAEELKSEAEKLPPPPPPPPAPVHEGPPTRGPRSRPG
jgi:hypothetical protein